MFSNLYQKMNWTKHEKCFINFQALEYQDKISGNLDFFICITLYLKNHKLEFLLKYYILMYHLLLVLDLRGNFHFLP